MNIKIENFANIKHLDIPLVSGKLNFLYGISGSGKSSISKALTIGKSEYTKYKTFGCNDEVKIVIDESLDFKIFDENARKEFIITKSGIGVYDVLYGENKELKSLRLQLENFLSKQELIDVRNIINRQNILLEQLEKTLGLKRLNSGKPSKTGLYKTLINSKDYVDEIPNITVEVKSWIKTGYNYVQDDICPFCNRKMTEKIIDRIKKIVDELPIEYHTIINAENQLKELGIKTDIKKINNKKIQDDLKKQIDDEYQILKEMNQIDNALNISFNDDKSLNQKVNIKISQKAIDKFNAVGINIKQLIEQLAKDKEGYTLNKKKYNSMLQMTIRKNIRKINDYISYFGIRYEFRKADYLSDREGYSLIHKDAESDTSEYLSTGEQNVISLILFLISYKKNDIIIDDPASSYDEYKREQILKIIFKIMFKEDAVSKTVLILSHDQIFLKFLCNYMKDVNYKSLIGEVRHLENINGNCRTVKIDSVDMNTILNHILFRSINSTSYAQQILNLRLFYEIKDNKSNEYKYLSAILHCKKENVTKECMTLLLCKQNCNEESLLVKIKNETGISLQTFNPKEVVIDLNDLSKFEQLCFIREKVKGDDKKELNSIVHFNYALQHLLNPYKFNFQSERSYSILDSYLEALKQEVGG